MEYDKSKVDEAVLALMYLTLHDHNRASKEFDQDTLDRLYERRLIENPRNENKPVELTQSGLSYAKHHFSRLFRAYAVTSTVDLSLSINFRDTVLLVTQNGNVVWSYRFSSGGCDCIFAIVDYMRREHNLLIGRPQAERILSAIGSIVPMVEERATTAKGRSLVTGKPAAIHVSSEMIREQLLNCIKGITWQAKSWLIEPTFHPAMPKALWEVVKDQPLEIRGEFASLHGLAEFMQQELGRKVYIALDPYIPPES